MPHQQRRIVTLCRPVAPSAPAIPPNAAATFAAASSQYLSAPSNATLQPSGSYTFAGWVRFNSLASPCGVLGKYSNSNNDTTGLVYFSGGILHFYCGGASYTTAHSTVHPSVGQWCFFVCWYDASTSRISISVNGETPSSAASSPPQLGATSFCLGLNTDAMYQYLDGTMDSVAYWSRILTAGEQAWLYNAGSGRRAFELAGAAGLKSGLVSWWDLDEASEVRKDAVGSNDLASTNGVGQGPGVD